MKPTNFGEMAGEDFVDDFNLYMDEDDKCRPSRYSGVGTGYEFRAVYAVEEMELHRAFIDIEALCYSLGRMI